MRRAAARSLDCCAPRKQDTLGDKTTASTLRVKCPGHGTTIDRYRSIRSSPPARRSDCLYHVRHTRVVSQISRIVIYVDFVTAIPSINPSTLQQITDNNLYRDNHGSDLTN